MGWPFSIKHNQIPLTPLKENRQIEEMKAELTEWSEIDSKSDNLAVTEDADVYEAIPIYL